MSLARRAKTPAVNTTVSINVHVSSQPKATRRICTMMRQSMMAITGVLANAKSIPIDTKMQTAKINSATDCDVPRNSLNFSGISDMPA